MIEAKASRQEKNGPRKKPGRLRRIVKWSCLGILAFILLLALAVFFLVFEGRRDAAPPELGLMEAYRLTSKVGDEVFSRDRLRSGEPQTLELSAAEVRTLVKMGQLAANGYLQLMRSRQPGVDNVLLDYDGDYFLIDASVFSGQSWVNGGAVPVRLKIRPQLADGRLTVETAQVRAGALPVPAGPVTDGINEEIAAREKKLAELYRAVKSLEILPDGSLRIVYDPARLLEVVRKVPFLAAQLGIQ